MRSPYHLSKQAHLNCPRAERYIRFTFSPQRFLLSAFTKLPLQFFHEYISHLVAGINKPAVIEPSLKIPIELDEGWMMHAARTFFMEKGYHLLGDARLHLKKKMMIELDNWIIKVMHPEELEFIERATYGREVAEDFLDFLQAHPDPGCHTEFCVTVNYRKPGG